MTKMYIDEGPYFRVYFGDLDPADPQKLHISKTCKLELPDFSPSAQNDLINHSN